MPLGNRAEIVEVSSSPSLRICLTPRRTGKDVGIRCPYKPKMTPLVRVDAFNNQWLPPEVSPGLQTGALAIVSAEQHAQLFGLMQRELDDLC